MIYFRAIGHKPKCNIKTTINTASPGFRGGAPRGGGVRKTRRDGGGEIASPLFGARNDKSYIRLLQFAGAAGRGRLPPLDPSTPLRFAQNDEAIVLVEVGAKGLPIARFQRRLRGAAFPEQDHAAVQAFHVELDGNS